MKFAENKNWRVLMSRMYGWGASVVILGALFKIMHWPYADIMLVVGMGTEVLVFFFSGFEPPAKDPDWSRIYPELADEEGVVSPVAGERRGPVTQHLTLSSNLDKLLEEADIGPELISNLGRGLRTLSDNVSRLTDISNAALATNQFIQNLETASKSVAELTQSYKNTAEFLKHDLGLSQEYSNSLKAAVSAIGDMGENYKKTAETARENLYSAEELSKSMKNMTTYSNQLGEAYSKNAELLNSALGVMESAAAHGQSYNEQLQKTAQHLASLNAAYEQQVQAAGRQSDSTEQLQTAIGTLSANLSDSIANTRKYQEELEQLTGNIRSLNNVYGNMLTAMNVNKIQ